MARKLKVYGWQILIGCELAEALGIASHPVQARAFVAAPSKAAIRRAMADATGGLFNLGEGANEAERQTALAAPGVIFVLSMDGGEPARRAPLRLEDFERNVGRAK